MRYVLAALIAGLALPAQAETHTGVIAQMRVDSNENPAVCVVMTPELPAARWACLYANRPHYLEMAQLVMRAFEKGARCTVEWSQVDSMTSRARIDAVSCFRPDPART